MRTVFDWGEAQPSGRGSEFNFERTDGVVRRAALRNLDVLPVIMYSPRWARAYRNRFTSPPKSRNDYVTYVAALVERYGPDGTFWTDHPETPEAPRARVADLERAAPARLLGRAREGAVRLRAGVPAPAARLLRHREEPRPRGEDRHGRHHAAGVGGDRGAVPARHQAVFRRRRPPDLPADGAALREGHRALSPGDEPARRPAASRSTSPRSPGPRRRARPSRSRTRSRTPRAGWRRSWVRCTRR